MSNPKHLTAWVNNETGEVFSPKGRLVYPALLEAKVNRKFPNNPPKFQTLLLIPKAANIDAIKAEIGRAAAGTHGAGWQKKKLRLPLKKTDDNPKLAEYAAEFPFCLDASANKDFPPFVFGPDAKPFKGESSEVYSGRWAVIAGSAWGYNTGSDGVGWNLNRIQLLDHDEAIAGGRVATAAGFEAADVSGSAPTTDDVDTGGSADDLWK